MGWYRETTCLHSFLINISRVSSRKRVLKLLNLLWKYQTFAKHCKKTTGQNTSVKDTLFYPGRPDPNLVEEALKCAVKSHLVRWLSPAPVLSWASDCCGYQVSHITVWQTQNSQGSHAKIRTFNPLCPNLLLPSHSPPTMTVSSSFKIYLKLLPFLSTLSLV